MGRPGHGPYKETLRHMQAELPPLARTVSKVIHAPVIEPVSDVVGAVLARPNALLFGGLFSFLISGVVYVVARCYGYRLSGFEATGSFVVGWFFGTVVDIIHGALRHR